MRTGIMAVLAVMVTAGLFAAVRFTDNGDGTVTDHGTGLVWQKCSKGQNALDCSGTATTENWSTALQYCRTLGLDSRDWRLPSVNELKSIVDYSTSNPSINTIYFLNTGSSCIWSSTTYLNSTNHAWITNFTYGTIEISNKSGANYVRCVTDGP